MKIAFIGQKGIPAHAGGVEKHVEKIATRLAALGHEVTVYTRPHYTASNFRDWKGVRLVSLPSIATKHLDAISHTFIATLHALFSDYEVIHFQSIGPSILSILPRVFRPSIRVIATFHSQDYFHQKWGSFARLCLKAGEFFTCRVPEKTIAVSRSLAEYARRVYGREAVYIPNGAEIEFETDTRPIKEFGLRPKQYVLSVSRLVAHKGIHYLIKAFQDIEHTGKLPNGMKLVIVGTHANTEEYEKYLYLLAAENPNILFLGEQHGKTLNALFSHAMVFVQPSEDEGLSLALLEAMAHGICPLVSDIPANLEAIGSDAGESFAVRDITGLRDRLAFLMNSPETLAEIGERSKERIEDEYSWDAIARRTAEVYQDVLKEKETKRRYQFNSKHAA